MIMKKETQKRANYIDAKSGNCKVIPAPFAIFLNMNDQNYAEPDISVICDTDLMIMNMCTVI